jgi:hypothetical protein
MSPLQGEEYNFEKPRTGLLLNRKTHIYLAPTTQAGSLGVHGGRLVAPGVRGRDLGRPHSPRGGAMWPGLISAKACPDLGTSEMVLPPCRGDIDSCGCDISTRRAEERRLYACYPSASRIGNESVLHGGALVTHATHVPQFSTKSLR